jgi:phage tail-like protein
MGNGITKKLKVPNLVGLSVRNAVVILKACGFPEPDVRFSESYAPRLSVVEQTPTRGQIVDGDSVVKLTVSQRNLVRFLPYIFQREGADGSNFLRDFLWIPQHLLESIDETIDNIHQVFDPHEAPEKFLPWLASWAAFVLDDNWPVEKKRYLIKKAVELYRVRGTVRGLKVFLKLFTGVEPDVIENEWPFDGFRIGVTSTIGIDSIILPPVNRAHCFVVDFPIHPDEVTDNLIIQIHDIIQAQKPAHTTYFLRFMGERRTLSTFGIVIGEHAVGSGLEITEIGESDADQRGAVDVGWES